jgi:protocatechuate 3,4-dioxygenase alpha subunit
VEPTPSQTIGPFFGFALPYEGGAELPGGDVRLHGTVRDGDGEPVPDALIEIWASDVGFGRCPTDDDGRFEFVVARAPHVAVAVFARGLLQRLATRIYFPDETESEVPDPALVAAPEGDGLRFDINLQGDGETPFFDV